MSKFKLPMLVLCSCIIAAPVPASNPQTEPKLSTLPPPPAQTPVLLLAQTCVAEIGFDKDTRECQLMWEINGRNAERSNRTISHQTKLFNAYWKDPNKRRPWIQYLNAEGQKPHFWPDKAAAWKIHKPLWEAYLEAAKKFQKRFKSKRYRPLCRRADDYGGRCDDSVHACDTPKQRCAKPIWCLNGKTHQAYWSLSCCRDRQKCLGISENKQPS